MVVLVIVLAIGASVAGVVTDPDFKQEIQENRENFERYCTERFGEDATVYVGGGQGVHGGLHCEGEEHKAVHLGAVEPSTWEAYKNGDASTEDVTNSLRDVGFMGNVEGEPNPWKISLGLTAVAGVVIVGVNRFRTDGESDG